MNKKGLSPIIVILVIAVFALGLSAGAYYLYSSKKVGTVDYSYSSLPTIPPSSITPAPVSGDDSMQKIESELGTTSEGSIDSDLKQLDSDFTSL